MCWIVLRKQKLFAFSIVSQHYDGSSIWTLLWLNGMWICIVEKVLILITEVGAGIKYWPMLITNQLYIFVEYWCFTSYGIRHFGQHWFWFWLFVHTSPHHYMNQCCLIENLTYRKKSQGNSKAKLYTYSFMKMHLKMSAKWHLFYT